MKKTKWLKSLGAVSALTLPMATILTTTSCGNNQFAELTSEMKDSIINEFITFSKNVHRNVWDEQESYNYVKKVMAGLGIDVAGSDRWAEVPEVQTMLKSDSGRGSIFVGPESPDYGNIWYDIPASDGCQDWPKVILQAHLDSSMEFSNDEVKKTWVKSSEEGGGTTVTYDIDRDIVKGDNSTSIGADNGIGIILLLTIARMRNEFKHGGIRLLFTAGESEATENYSAGAAYLKYDQMNEGRPIGQTTGTSYLNSNSKRPFGDTEGEFKYIISTAGVEKNTILKSSAGIHECSVVQEKLSLNTDDNKIDWDEEDPIEPLPEQPKRTKQCFTLSVSNCHGGHSASDINSGYANALGLLMRCLTTGDDHMQIINASTTNKSAFTISSDANVTFATFMPEDVIQMRIESFWNMFRCGYPGENWSESWLTPGADQVTVTLAKIEDPKNTYKYGLSKAQSSGVLDLIGDRLTFGPVDWFDVETKKNVACSVNFGPLKIKIDQDGTAEKSYFEFHCVERSAHKNQLQVFYSLIHRALNDCLTPIFGSTSFANHIDNQVWEPQDENKMSDLMVDCYKDYKLPINAKNEHGWAEIACFPEIYDEQNWKAPHMAVTGVQILNNHTAKESIYTDTLETEIKTLLLTLSRMNELA